MNFKFLLIFEFELVPKKPFFEIIIAKSSKPVMKMLRRENCVGILLD